jgi:alkane 1-monooxygenase
VGDIKRHAAQILPAKSRVQNLVLVKIGVLHYYGYPLIFGGMKRIEAFKYLLVLTLPAAAAVSFSQAGWLTYLPVIYAFGAIPMLEFLFKPNPKNLEETELALRKADRLYDWMLYLIVLVQYLMLGWFFVAVTQPGLQPFEIAGRITAMGLLCGVLGINVAHELGHRVKKEEQFMAKALLLTSLYMHFFIEHNRGHHKNVSTPIDPSSARHNEWLPVFWARSVFGAYRGAWHLEHQRLRRKKVSLFSLKNEMLVFTLVQGALLATIGFAFGPVVLGYFMAAATLGFLLLETVNYIEHYGLARKKVSDHRYEDTQPQHSWNSNHVVGRLMLFELSRHADHHYQPAKKYQTLNHHNNSPQMPTGYPGMMLLAALPPLWFWVMNKRVAFWQQKEG